MPLTKRLVEPVCLGREKIPAGVKNELEFVTNNTLANVILQLSNLSKHAEDLFGEIHSEATGFIQRASSLQTRIDRLAVKVTELDSTMEEVTLADISLKKQFRSSNLQNDRVVSRDTLPNAMRDAYEGCDMPPPLDKLNPYRTDGKEGLKFYTDPDYFFELWKKNMLEGGEKPRNDRPRKTGRSRASSENRTAKQPIRQPQNHLEQMRAKTLAQESGYPGGSPVPTSAISNAKSGYPYASDQYGMMHNIPAAASYDAGRYGTIRSQSRPGKLDLPLPYDARSPENMEETIHMVDYRAAGNFASAVQSPQPVVSEAVLRSNTRGTPTRPNQPPPAPPSTGSGTLSTRSTPTSGREVFPPPPPDMQTRLSLTPPPNHDFPPPPGLESVHHGPVRSGPAPPPPPPPPVGILGPSNPAGSSTADSSARQKSVEATPGPSMQASTSRLPAPVKVNNTMVDTRSDLLAAIRGGINLRKVEQQNQQQSRRMEPGKVSSLHNVAEIIARRKAMQHSDSDTSSETEADSDWDENH